MRIRSVALLAPKREEHGNMRNIWKGLIIGGLTGAGAGAVVDLFDRGARLVGVAGRKAADMAPEAADRVKSAVSSGVARVHDAEIADSLRDQAKEIVHRIGDSEQVDQTRDVLEHARDLAKEKGKQVARTLHDTMPLRLIG
jgi:gas vesicle protein